MRLEACIFSGDSLAESDFMRVFLSFSFAILCVFETSFGSSRALLPAACIEAVAGTIALKPPQPWALLQGVDTFGGLGVAERAEVFHWILRLEDELLQRLKAGIRGQKKKKIFFEGVNAQKKYGVGMQYNRWADFDVKKGRPQRNGVVLIWEYLISIEEGSFAEIGLQEMKAELSSLI